MNHIFKTLILIAFIACNNHLQAQDLIVNTHTYSFKDAQSKEVINNLHQDLQNIEFVSDVKIKYTEIKKSGLLIVTTSERPVVKEHDHVFSIASLKNALLKYNITPIEYRLIENSKN